MRGCPSRLGSGGPRPQAGIEARDSTVGLPARGAVTAEFAVLLPVTALLMAVVLGAASAGVAKLRCIDAARTAARLAARHESSTEVVEAARTAGPREARVQVWSGADRVRVTVSARVAFPLPGGAFVNVAATSVAHLEETGSPQPGLVR
jgi:hypothetical protein